MKRVFIACIFFLPAIALFSSCGHRWTKADKKDYVNSCLTLYEGITDTANLKEFCEGNLKIVLKKYPDKDSATAHAIDIMNDPDIKALLTEHIAPQRSTGR